MHPFDEMKRVIAAWHAHQTAQEDRRKNRHESPIKLYPISGSENVEVEPRPDTRNR